jgi:hypothetical protein
LEVGLSLPPPPQAASVTAASAHISRVRVRTPIDPPGAEPAASAPRARFDAVDADV